MTRSIPTFYLFHGDDDLSIDEAVNKLRMAMGDDSAADLNISEFDGQTVNVGEALGAVSSYPFLADKRLVIVKGLVSWITRKGAGETGKRAVEQLEAELPNLPEYARLVLVERGMLADNNRIVKLAKSQANGYEKAFGAPKDPTGWLIKRARDEYQAELEPRAAAGLASVIGDDLRRADNELFKLVAYVGTERPITEEDVTVLTPYVAEANLFEMVDALAEGRGEVAAKLIHKLLHYQKQDPFSLYGMIVRQFRLLLLAREHLATGGGPGNLASALKIHSFVAQKLAKQSRSFNVQQLEQVYRALLDYDIQMKTGRIDPLLALDLFIASMSQ